MKAVAADRDTATPGSTRGDAELHVMRTRLSSQGSEVMNQRQSLPHGVVLVLGLAVLLDYVDRGSLATAASLPFTPSVGASRS